MNEGMMNGQEELRLEAFRETQSSSSSCISSYISRPRILYATTFVWLSVVGGRFLAPFLEHQANLSPAQIGVCLSLQQIALTFLSSLAGAWADAQEAAESQVQSSSAAAASSSSTGGAGRAKVILWGVMVATLAFVLHGLQNYVLLPWWSHAALQALQGMGLCMVFPVLDGLTIEYLEHESSTTTGAQDYGRERLHGPLWWAVTNLLLSPLFDAYGFAICYPLAVSGAILVVASVKVYTRSLGVRGAVCVAVEGDNNEDNTCKHNSDNDEAETARLSLWNLLGLIVATGYGISFLICIFCISAGQAVVDNLVFLFFEALGSDFLVMGITVVVKIAAEVPIFYWGPVLLRRFGAAPVLLLGCACYLVRVLAYPHIPMGQMIYVLLLEPLHGITYGAVQVAMVDFVAQAMPLEYEASGQGLIYLFKDGGSVLGVLMGGVADRIGGPNLMFALSAGFVTAGASVLGIVMLCQKPSRPTTHHQELTQMDEEDEVLPRPDCESMILRRNEECDEDEKR